MIQKQAHILTEQSSQRQREFSSKWMTANE